MRWWHDAPTVALSLWFPLSNVIGDGRFDWLPEKGEPCWALLAGKETNVVAFNAAG
ncbi:MAG: hypothetical protein KIT22_08290 [Verrucomicrobiae bacterium]|nr:hypothetical protein [Verrucomicrobiae bacterium]